MTTHIEQPQVNIFHVIFGVILFHFANAFFFRGEEVSLIPQDNLVGNEHTPEHPALIKGLTHIALTQESHIENWTQFL